MYRRSLTLVSLHNDVMIMLYVRYECARFAKACVIAETSLMEHTRSQRWKHQRYPIRYQINFLTALILLAGSITFAILPRQISPRVTSRISLDTIGRRDG